MRVVASLRLSGSVDTTDVTEGVKERSRPVATLPEQATPSHVVPVQGPVPADHDERAAGLPRSDLTSSRATSWAGGLGGGSGGEGKGGEGYGGGGAGDGGGKGGGEGGGDGGG